MPNILLAIIVRSSSRRLPQKWKKSTACGYGLLDVLSAKVAAFERNLKVASSLCICTSDEYEDRKILEYAARNNLKHHAGSLLNVASRLVGAMVQNDADFLLRFTGDNPYISFDQVARLASLVEKKSPPDYATFDWAPIGLGLELFSRDFLERIAHARNQQNSEYLTYFALANREHLMIDLLTSGIRTELGSFKFSVDNQADFEFFDAALTEYIDKRGIPQSWKRVIDYDLLSSALLSEKGVVSNSSSFSRLSIPRNLGDFALSV